MRQVAKLTLALLLALLLAACGPEDGRPRGGGPGADIGNYTSTVVPESKVFSGDQP
jgi:hypothetical protein